MIVKITIGEGIDRICSVFRSGNQVPTNDCSLKQESLKKKYILLIKKII